MKRYATEILEKVIQQIKEEQELTEDTTHALYAFFDDQLYESIHIAESEAEPKYCSCKEFLDQVVCNEETLLCRHVLAVILSEVFNSYKSSMVDDITFAEEYYKFGIPQMG
ncbi:hypothetical protein G6F46_008657 [Rhizopus delemar]|uniref:SWIM-type domain-containing protein n=2 Tax=Rhizopus TaxID=4842 RepID=A0A9P7CKW7_9FUNG|nr:hypothetical protein G6F43_003302 [Rhizopus delemar]KAG1536861.1 hypothetical protein G6F51_010715 [Rhizopus arrhizus]KAG1454641.1 hypothetical protein G6F55_007499 [Rhizopus delemar]KAG1493859.1 hypothetical protein G6F54_008286 [Rhizopus delemar]KAG1504300.1 hypothetical protein G6F53_010424 [Rhizopus delemar]